MTSVSVLGEVALCFGEMRTAAQIRGERKQIHNRSLPVWTRAGEQWRPSAHQQPPCPPVDAAVPAG